ncbi:MAG: RES family NAD+ phosphorylase [Mycobacteriales bacterium]
MSFDVATKEFPPNGVWRVAQALDPFKARHDSAEELTAEELEDPGIGNRFDSPLPGRYGTVYFGTQLECCFAETLSRYRPDPRLLQFAHRDQEDGDFMAPGEVPADWRTRRLAIRAAVTGGVFLDVEASETRVVLEKSLHVLINAFGYEHLDMPAVMSGDRRLTRFISQWAWSRHDERGDPIFAGIRYVSRLDSRWECWAVFDRSPIIELERRNITRNMEALAHVCELYGLLVF